MKKLFGGVSAVGLTFLLAMLSSVPAFAGDPPGRVLRLDYISGQVSMQPGSVDDWVAATLNRPFTTADRIWTDKDSKAELQLGTAALRMASETSMTVSNLNDSTVQVELDQGTLNLHVSKLYPGEIYEIDTPNVAFTVLKPGDYRFEVYPNGDYTRVIVWRGKGEGNGNGRGVEVKSGQMVRFEHGDTLMHYVADAPRPDGFDDWCQVRNERLANAQSLRYVSSDVIGYEDLDDYGYWQTVPTYGTVWVPRYVSPGWAPYRFGHWVWISPWGWTWVDDAPWGFAPFHYGRWVYSSFGWGWCPGPRVYRPVWGPAMVAWFGGPNWSIGFSFGGGWGVGWVPLGWGEPYYPGYHVSNTYIRNVNVTNTHITNITYVTNNYNNYINNTKNFTNVKYANQNAPGGVSVVPQSAFTHAMPVQKMAVAMNSKQTATAPMFNAEKIGPTRNSVLGVGQERPAPPNVAATRRIVTKTAPPERPQPMELRSNFNGRSAGGSATELKSMEMPKPARPTGSPQISGATDVRSEVSDTRVMSAAPASDEPGKVTRAVPRPPVREAFVDEGSAASQPARHEVPRPPTRMSPATVDSTSDVGAVTRPVGRPPQVRDLAPAADSPRTSMNPGNSGRSAGQDAELHQPHTVPQPPASSTANTTPYRPAPETRNSAPGGHSGNSVTRSAPEDRRSVPEVKRPASPPKSNTPAPQASVGYSPRPHSVPRPESSSVRVSYGEGTSYVESGRSYGPGTVENSSAPRGTYWSREYPSARSSYFAGAQHYSGSSRYSPTGSASGYRHSGRAAGEMRGPGTAHASFGNGRSSSSGSAHSGSGARTVR